MPVPAKSSTPLGTGRYVSPSAHLVEYRLSLTIADHYLG
jgi:hypothetical protein